MNEHAPTLEEWRELYEAVIRFKEIAPLHHKGTH